MNVKFEHEKNNESPPKPRLFSERFNIQVGLEEAKARFVNRVLNAIDSEFGGLAREHPYPYRYRQEMEHVASALGMEASGASPLNYCTGNDFARLLAALEAFYEALGKYKRLDHWERTNLDNVIQLALSVSEVELGVVWNDGKFWPSGAGILHEKLVSEPLKWLANPKYEGVLEPFQKGLRHYKEASNDPTKLKDAVIQMYEALEALARIVNNNNANLKANAERFVNNLKLSPSYAEMLKQWCEYIHSYRHAVKIGEKRIPPKHSEAEASIYITGLFVRLATQRLADI